MKFRVELTGAGRGLLMHNGRMANPLDPHAKALKSVNGKKNKSDEDYTAIALIEMEGGMYHDPEIGPYVPDTWLEAAFIRGAGKTGGVTQDNAKIAISAIDEMNRLEYAGPRDLETLKFDQNFRKTVTLPVSKTNRSRINRTRPFFRDWSCTAEFQVDTTIINPAVFEELVTVAGTHVGIGDWRPKYGLFTAKVVKL